VHWTDQARQHPRAAVLRDQPALGERRGQPGALRHVAEVAEQDEADSDAGDRAVDGGEDRLGNGQQVAEFLREVAAVPALLTAVAARPALGRYFAEARHVRAG